MKNFRFIIFLTLTVLLVSLGGEIMAQRSSYNKWDRIIFRNNPPFKQRVFSLTEINMGYGARYLDQDYEIRRTGISTLIGYRYSRAISVGLGTGIEAYNGGTMVPLYAEGQIYMNRLSVTSIKPFITGAAGMLNQVSGNNTNIKVFANPSFGFLIPVTFRSSLSVSLGLYTQWALDEQRYSFINTKIGLLFY